MKKLLPVLMLLLLAVVVSCNDQDVTQSCETPNMGIVEYEVDRENGSISFKVMGNMPNVGYAISDNDQFEYVYEEYSPNQSYTVYGIEEGKDYVLKVAGADRNFNIHVETAYFSEDALNKLTMFGGMPKSFYDGFKSDEPDPDPLPQYKVGDLYDDGYSKGVVISVSEDGTSGKVISVDEEELAWSLVFEFVNAFSSGEYNTQDMQRMSNWEENYPAVKWCVDHGPGWYFPDSGEMMSFMYQYYSNPDLFEQHFEVPFKKAIYWSSSEIYDEMAECVSYENTGVCLDSWKYLEFRVRAFKKF